MSMPSTVSAGSSPVNISTAVGSGSQALREPALSSSRALPHAQPTGRMLSSDAVHFGGNDTNSSGQRPAAAAPPSMIMRLNNAVKKTFVWNDPSGRCIKSDLKWGVGIALLTSPFALLIPGSHLLIISAVVGWRIGKRFAEEVL